jgi:hypothetical protein
LAEFRRSPLGGNARFEDLKERFLIVHAMLRAHREAPYEKKEHVAGLILTSKDLKGVEKALINSEASQGLAAVTYHKVAAAFKSAASAAFSNTGYGLYDNARMEAHRMSEGDFMEKLLTSPVDEPVLAVAAAEIEEYFIQKLREQVHVLSSRWAQFVAKFELDAFMQHQRLEATALDNQDRLASRAELLKDLRKDLAQNRPS